jgi:hypothetical protein
VVERARIVLFAAEDLENKQIAVRMNITPEKAALAGSQRWEMLSACRNSGGGG